MQLFKIQHVRKRLLSVNGFQSANVTTVKYLAEDIFNITGDTISYNTLRRFFGMMECASPSTKTWLVLDHYLRIKEKPVVGVGFDGIIQWEPMHEVFFLINLKKYDELLVLLKKHNGLPQFPYLFGMLTYHLLSTKNKEVLTLIFTCDELFEEIETTADYVGEFVSLCLRDNYTSYEHMLESVFALPNFKKCSFYSYIDYAHLNGYYSKVISDLPVRKLDDELFRDTMLAYGNYLSGFDVKPLSIHPSKDDLKGVFPVLVGRYLGYRMISEPNNRDAIWNDFILPLSEEMDPHLFLVELSLCLVLLKEYAKLQELIERYYEGLYEHYYWYSNTPICTFRIVESFLYLNEGDVKRAHIVYDSINIETAPNSYYMYLKLFYAILSYHLLEEESEKQVHLERYNHFAELTGFNRFTESFLFDFCSKCSVEV